MPRTSHLFRLSEPADRDLRNDGLQNLFRDGSHHLRIDVTGRDAQLTVIPFFAFSWASAFVKPIIPAFAAGDVALPDLAFLAVHGGNIDNPPEPAVTHSIDDGLHHIPDDTCPDRCEN